MKVLVCPDSFKGSLSAGEVSIALEKGIKKAEKSLQVIQIPMADGGEGTAEILGKHLGFEQDQISTQNAFEEPVSLVFWKKNEDCFFDIAALAGHQLLDQNHSVLQATSACLAKTLYELKTAGFRNITIALGGSGIADAGLGFAKAIGEELNVQQQELVAFLDIQTPKIIQPDFLSELNIRALVDVNATLHGVSGSALVFGKQKGLSEQQRIELDKCLVAWANGTKRQKGVDPSLIPGAGAAGGMGYALMVFAKAKLLSGSSFIAEQIGLEKQIAECDIVLTGEGKLDNQSKQGKVVHHVAQLANKHNKPVFGIVGSAADNDIISGIGLDGAIQLIGPDVSEKDAIERAAFHLEDCAYTLIKYLQENE
ncbi:MAG: glycerate kinase [Bacteroidetes bacterium]|nr:glycerate kinase [Bacteroidota bacterium]